MHGAGKFFGQYGIDQAVTLDAGQSAKTCGNDGDTQVKAPRSFRVSRVSGAVVGDNKRFRLQCGFKLALYGGQECRGYGMNHAIQLLPKSL